MGIVTETLDRVETNLNYACEGGFSPEPVPVYDARPLLDHLTLDRQGFVLRRVKFL
jgi:hypothetical protein